MAKEKMNIGILTYHRALNYGAVLQAYALNYYINNSLGYNCEIIDYRSDYLESWYRVFVDYNWHRNIREFTTNVKVYSKRTRKKLGFYTFIKPFISKSLNREELKTIQNKYDLFIAGSDQIWNTNISGNDFTYLLDFVSDDLKKASYAASIGKQEISSDVKGLFDRYVSQFEYLSVREQRDVNILNEQFNKKSELCIDPTLLIDEEIWRNISKDINKNEKYIFIYAIEEPQNLYRHAIDLANTYGYKVCVLSYEFRDFKKYQVLRDALREKFEIINAATPQEFLGYVKNAELVLTNSFHGTIFSIIFNKQFMVETISKSGNVNDRAQNICNLLELKDRMYITDQEFDNYTNQIDWNLVSKNLVDLRMSSKKYLSFVLSDREKQINTENHTIKNAPYENKKNCCGCSACYAVCPVNAIFMATDEEGFLYPKIKTSVCIGCNKCVEVCSFKKTQKDKGFI